MHTDVSALTDDERIAVAAALRHRHDLVVERIALRTRYGKFGEGLGSTEVDLATVKSLRSAYTKILGEKLA